MRKRTRLAAASAVIAMVAISVAGAFGAGGLIQLVAYGAQDVYLNANGIGGVSVSTSGPTDVVTQQVTYHPGDSSGWQHHPGVVLLTVQSGSGTLYQANCTSRVYSAHQAFTESGPHPTLFRNESDADTVVYETYLVPHGSALQIGDTTPGCAAH